MLSHLLLSLAAALPGPQVATAAEQTPRILRVGLTSLRGEDVVTSTWQDFVDQVEDALAPIALEAVPLPLDAVLTAAQEGRIDVVLHHPLLTLQLEFAAGGRQLLSMRRRVGEDWLRSMGSVIFTRASRPGPGDLTELVGHDVAAVAPNSYGGWVMARHTLHERGIGTEDLGSVHFTSLPHDRVVERVLAGESDYGVVRTGVLESLAGEGRLALDDLRLIGARSSPGFPLLHSTALMPEFSLVALPSVDEDLANAIVRGLLSLGDEGDIAWSVPRDLTSVRGMMADLEIFPYAPVVPPPLIQQLARHPWTPTVTGLACALAALVVARVALLRGQSRALEASLAATEELGRAKANFLANMSHEIRTPMTAIVGYAELLADPEFDAAGECRRLEAARTIDAHCRHLLTILDDILDMSKLDAGRVAVERIPIDPAQLARESLELLRQRADGKGLRLELELADDVPARVEGDPTRLRQILLNLIGNAVKFTEVGAVTLRMSHDRRTDRLSIDVVDTGAGLTPEQVTALSAFRPFEQADASTTRTHGGTGLGLSISQGLAELMGGGLSIESQRGVGSTFRVVVQAPPVADVEQAPAIEPTSADRRDSLDANGLHGVRVLLVEDGPDNRRLLAFLLRKAGAEVETAEHGAQALDRLLEQSAAPPIDLVLIDMQMPVLDGYDATRELRRHGYAGPIVALTAHALPEDRQRCLDAGCDDFATKPIDRRTLLSICTRWTSRAMRASAWAPAPSSRCYPPVTGAAEPGRPARRRRRARG